jgi:hypothetical protein
MEKHKVACPECKTINSVTIGDWVSCKSCRLQMSLENLTPNFLELRIGRIEKEKFYPKDLGNVYFICKNGSLIQLELKNLTEIMNFKHDQAEFDRNLIAWQEKGKPQPFYDSQYSSEILSPIPFRETFWQNGYDMARRLYPSLQPAEPGYVRDNAKGFSEKEIPSKIILHPEFWQIGLIRSQKPTNFYLHPLKVPEKNTGNGIGTGCIEILIFLLIIILVISIVVLLSY